MNFPNNLRDLLARLVPAERLDPAAAQLAGLARMIIEAPFNLTADRAPELFWPRHIEDTLRAALELVAVYDSFDALRILDVGSGGGIPGLAWAILWPRAHVVLLESTGKKVNFLRAAAESLNLTNVVVQAGRAEELAHQPNLREAFDLVTARALAVMPVLLELTLPFAAVGGRVAANKSAESAAEWAGASRALKLLGAPYPTAHAQRHYHRSDDRECILYLVTKTQPTPPEYPRAIGRPLKHPL